MTESPEELLYRHFTDDFHTPYDMFRWAERTVQRDTHELKVLFPENWGQGDVERMLHTAFWPEERDLRQVIDRIVNPLTKAGFEAGYFKTEREADIFHDELKYLLTAQTIILDEEVWRCVGRQEVTLQLAENSLKAQPISDIFMRAVEADGEWSAQAPPKQTGKARSIWQDIVRDIWRYSDTTVVFPDIAKTRRMTKSSSRGPSGQLALLAFVTEEGTFKLDALKQAVRILTVALDILIDYVHNASENTYKHRPIEIGFTQLSLSLQSMGIAYDSEAGRAKAAFAAAFITGTAYETSELLAARLGPFAQFKPQLGRVSRILRGFQQKSVELPLSPEESEAVKRLWGTVVQHFKRRGVRNCQVSKLSTTSNIAPLESLLMSMKLPTGGAVEIVQPTVATGLRRLEYNKAQTTEIINYIHEQKGKITGAPHVNKRDNAVFELQEKGAAHQRMIMAIQPFLSGGIQQPLLLPPSATPRDVEQFLLEAWQSGVEYSHIIRKNSEQRPKEEEMQPNTPPEEPKKKEAAHESAPSEKNQATSKPTQRAQPRPLPRVRNAKTFAFEVAGYEGHFTVGEYDNGAPGELFISVAKVDAATVVMMGALAQSVSRGLQYGVPLAEYVRSMVSLQFAPNGTTDDPDIPEAGSIMDYVMRRMALHYLTLNERIAIGLDTEEAAVQRAQDRQAKLVE